MWVDVEVSFCCEFFFFLFLLVVVVVWVVGFGWVVGRLVPAVLVRKRETEEREEK